MKKILITGVNGDIGEGIGRILIKEFPRFDITGADSSGKYPGSFIFSKVISAPPASDNKYKKYLQDCIKKYNLIIPTNEPEIKKISSLYDLNKKSPFLILPNNITKTFFNKYQTYLFLKSKGFSCPKTKLLEDISELKLPMFMKPIYGAGGKGNKLLENKYDVLSARLLPNKEWVVQEYLNESLDEYTCSIFKKNSFIRTLQFKRKLYGDRTGIAEVVDNPSIKKLLLDLSKKLDFNGCLNVQLKLDNDEPKIFEINPRISSTVMMRNKIGFQDCIWWVKSYFNLPLGEIKTIKPGIKIFRMSKEYVTKTDN